MTDPTPLQQAMISELAEFIDPVGLEMVGANAIRCGTRWVIAYWSVCPSVDHRTEVLNYMLEPQPDETSWSTPVAGIAAH